MSLLQVETLRTDEIQVSGPPISSFFVFGRLDQQILQPKRFQGIPRLD